MRESRSYRSVGERGGNEPLYPEAFILLGNLENPFFRTTLQIDFSLILVLRHIWGIRILMKNMRQTSD